MRRVRSAYNDDRYLTDYVVLLPFDPPCLIRCIPRSSCLGSTQPISLLPLPYRPNTRILPSIAPPLLISVIIAHPRLDRADYSRTPSRANLMEGDDYDDDDMVEQLEDVEVGLAEITVKGDWRYVTGVTSLGFLE